MEKLFHRKRILVSKFTQKLLSEKKILIIQNYSREVSINVKKCQIKLALV